MNWLFLIIETKKKIQENSYLYNANKVDFVHNLNKKGFLLKI